MIMRFSNFAFSVAFTLVFLSTFWSPEQATAAPDCNQASSEWERIKTSESVSELFEFAFSYEGCEESKEAFEKADNLSFHGVTHAKSAVFSTAEVLQGDDPRICRLEPESSDPFFSWLAEQFAFDESTMIDIAEDEVSDALAGNYCDVVFMRRTTSKRLIENNPNRPEGLLTLPEVLAKN